MNNIWKVYYPDDGETAEDAVELKRAPWALTLTGKPRPIIDPEDAASLACERDYGERDGWERGDSPFQFVIISPDGVETLWKAWHEPSVEHHVEMAERDNA